MMNGEHLGMSMNMATVDSCLNFQFTHIVHLCKNNEQSLIESPLFRKINYWAQCISLVYVCIFFVLDLRDLRAVNCVVVHTVMLYIQQTV